MSDTSPPKRAKSRVKWVLFLLVILTTVCLASYWSWHYYHNKEKIPPPPTLPVFMPLDTFTVNLVGDEEEIERVLYIGIILRLPDEQILSRFNDYLPEIRSRILLLLSAQKSTLLATQQGKHQLAEEIKAILRPPVLNDQSEQMVDDVLFTDFILR